MEVNYYSTRNQGYRGVQVIAPKVGVTEAEWKRMSISERGTIFTQLVNDWVVSHVNTDDVRYTRLNLKEPSIQITCSIARRVHLFYFTLQFLPAVDDTEEESDDKESADILAE